MKIKITAQVLERLPGLLTIPWFTCRKKKRAENNRKNSALKA